MVLHQELKSHDGPTGNMISFVNVIWWHGEEDLGIYYCLAFKKLRKSANSEPTVSA